MRKMLTVNTNRSNKNNEVVDDTPVDTVIEKDRSKTKTKRRKKEAIDLTEYIEHVSCECDSCKERDSKLTVESVFDICRSYVEDNDLFDLLRLHTWKIKLDVDTIIDDEGLYLGLCEYDTAYSLATIRIAVNGHETADDVKDTLMHELCHVVLAEMDSSARALVSTLPENLQEYVGHQLHDAREHSVINLANIFRSIVK